MSKITDELRKYSKSSDGVLCSAHQAILAIADRIDAEHEKAVQEKSIRVYTSDADMEHDGWLRLPKDADGEVVHMGDLMDNTHKDGFRAKRVTGIAYHEHGRTTIEVDEDRLRWHNADKLRHNHEPTVEDVLREFGNWYAHTKGGCDEDGIVAEYAAKLQLKEEA